MRSCLAAPNLTVIHEQLISRVPFDLRLNFPSLVEYACRAEFLPLDNDVFTYEAHTRKNGSGGCSGGLKNVFRFMATYPHHLSHLSAIESGIHAMARAVDGNAILYNSQTATNAKGFIRASVLLRYISSINLSSHTLSENPPRFRLEGFYVTPDTYDHQGPCSMTQLSS